ncbi:unnamed protein product, partial [Rotaria sp. Silwood2]
MITAQHTILLNKCSGQHSFGIYMSGHRRSGIYIITMESNSPAADANIRPGDRVLAINGQPVSKISKKIFLKIANNAQSLILS